MILEAREGPNSGRVVWWCRALTADNNAVPETYFVLKARRLCVTQLGTRGGSTRRVRYGLKRNP
jgi:hypothetical protein